MDFMQWLVSAQIPTAGSAFLLGKVAGDPRGPADAMPVGTAVAA